MTDDDESSCVTKEAAAARLTRLLESPEDTKGWCAAFDAAAFDYEASSYGDPDAVGDVSLPQWKALLERDVSGVDRSVIYSPPLVYRGASVRLSVPVKRPFRRDNHVNAAVVPVDDVGTPLSEKAVNICVVMPEITQHGRVTAEGVFAVWDTVARLGVDSAVKLGVVNDAWVSNVFHDGISCDGVATVAANRITVREYLVDEGDMLVSSTSGIVAVDRGYVAVAGDTGPATCLTPEAAVDLVTGDDLDPRFVHASHTVVGTILRGTRTPGAVSGHAFDRLVPFLTKFEVFASGSIAAVGRMTNLKSLAVNYSPATDLRFVAGSTALKSLEVYQCKNLNDVSALAGLKSLEVLSLYGCVNVKDVTALAGLTALKTLDLHGTGVADLSPLAGLKSLVSLDITGCPASDLSFLTGAKSLKTLNMAGVRCLPPFGALPSLESVVLPNRQTLDLSFPVFSIDLGGCHWLRDVSPLMAFRGLECVDISVPYDLLSWGCEKVDLAPLKRLRQLKAIVVGARKPVLTAADHPAVTTNRVVGWSRRFWRSDFVRWVQARGIWKDGHGYEARDFLESYCRFIRHCRSEGIEFSSPEARSVGLFGYGVNGVYVRAGSGDPHTARYFAKEIHVDVLRKSGADDVSSGAFYRDGGVYAGFDNREDPASRHYVAADRVVGLPESRPGRRKEKKSPRDGRRTP